MTSVLSHLTRVGLVACVVLAACKKSAPPQYPPPDVTVLTVHPEKVEAKLDYVGQAEASKAVEVRSQITGVIVARHWGFTPDAMRSVEKDGAACIALDAERFVVLVPMDRAPALWEKLAENATPAGPDAWSWSLAHAGIPVIGAATQDAFVPQMANFDLVGGVSFKKGCYPGQEIVARTHYRGILKRRMALAHLVGDARPLPGQSVYSGAFGDQAAGAIVNVAAAPEGGFDLLVVAQIESLDKGDLRWNAPDGPPLEVRERPYASELSSVPLTRA